MVPSQRFRIGANSIPSGATREGDVSLAADPGEGNGRRRRAGRPRIHRSPPPAGRVARSPGSAPICRSRGNQGSRDRRAHPPGAGRPGIRSGPSDGRGGEVPRPWEDRGRPGTGRSGNDRVPPSARSIPPTKRRIRRRRPRKAREGSDVGRPLCLLDRPQHVPEEFPSCVRPRPASGVPGPAGAASRAERGPDRDPRPGIHRSDICASSTFPGPGVHPILPGLRSDLCGAGGEFHEGV